MSERVLILRHASGIVNRARRVAMAKWPSAKLEVHDLAAYGKPPKDFRWDRYIVILVDDEYLRKEGLLWLAELRSPNFPKIVRVTPEPGRPAPPPEIEVKPIPQPKKPEKAEKSQPAVESPSMIARADARRLKDAEDALKAAGITGFTPVRPLGSGATANVCLCERGPEREKVVLKVLKSEGSGDSDLLSRFVQEYFAASSIDSPYVAKVFEHGFSETHAYIVMEYFPAGDLRARIARDRPNPEESLIIIGSILAALTSVHNAGIIHRDLKPANVMFRDNGTIALVDFGSARRDADPVAKTLAGVVIGTPYYLSPEQALGGTADERSDLYSVGVMLYELLTGQRMYAAPSLVALFEMHKTAPIPKLPAPHAHHQVFLEKLVAKQPAERFNNAAEALDALLAHMAENGETASA
jgi:serine/threonine protein kinase